MPPAFPESAALVSGVWLGLELGWCPIWATTLLGALGLALGRVGGRFVSFLALGMLSALQPGRAIYHPAPDRPVTVELKVLGPWRFADDGWRTATAGIWLRQGLRVVPWTGRATLAVPLSSPPPASSRVLRVRGYLRRGPPLANGVPASPAPWLLRVKSHRLVSPVACPRPRVFQLYKRVGEGLQRALESRLTHWELRGGGHGPGLVRALVLGRPHSLPGAVSRGLRAAGLAHLVALSGLHVGLLVGAALMASSKLQAGFRLPLALLAAALYLLLAGGRPSLLRASAMMAAILAAWLLKRPPQSVNTLAWVAAGMVLVSPQLLRDLGFQLTVAATGGILTIAPLLSQRAFWLPAWLRQPVCVSLAAQLTVLPWSLSTFHLVSPLAVLWNLITVPWVTFVLMTAFSWALTTLTLPPLGRALEPVLDILALPLEMLGLLSPEILGTLPVSFGWWHAVGMTVALGVTLLAAGAKRILAAAIVIALIAMGPQADVVDPELVMIDVGQGEAILLRDGRQALLLDGGGWRRADIAQRILLPTLTSMGVRRLDGIVLSHPDTDHCAGLLALSSYMRVERFYTSPGWNSDPCVLRLLTRFGPAVRVLWRGDHLDIGRWNLQVLHPAAGSRQGRNDRSLVLSAQVRRRRVLLTGDLEVAGERDLLGQSDPKLGEVTILKVGHHGSGTSTSQAWLRRIRPRLALISCGVANRYGHPDGEVLARLRDRHVLVMRTDITGALRLVIDPAGNIQVSMPGSPRGSAR